MAFTLDPQTEKITFGVVSDGTHDGIARAIADIFGASESFREDFSTNDAGWISTDSAKIDVNTSTGVVDWELVRDDTNDALYIDLGAGNISDTLWTLRFKMSVLELNDGTNVTGYVGLSDLDGTVIYAGPKDFLGMFWQQGTATKAQGSVDINNGNMQTGQNASFTTPISLTDFYYEIVRTSSTGLTMRIFSDKNYTNLIEENSEVISSSISSLRYLVIQNIDSTTQTATAKAEVDDIQFWDGVTAPSILTNNWRIRFKLDITNLDDGANATDKRLYMLMTDEDVTSDAENPQDSLGLVLRHDNAISNFSLLDTNGGAPAFTATESTFATAPSASTFFVEIKRTSSSAYEASLYPDSTYTTPTETELGSVSVSTLGLRYLKFMNASNENGVGAIDGTIDDINFTDIDIMAVETDKTFIVDALIEDLSPTWSYREHELNTNPSFAPRASFGVEVASPNRFETATGPPASGVSNNYLFKTFKKSKITGSTVSIIWEKAGVGGLTSNTFRVIDGNYDKDSLTDFVPGAGGPTSKGAGVLGSFSSFPNHAEQTVTLTGINWGASTETEVTIIAFITDTNAGVNEFDSLFIKEINIQDAPNTSFTWKFDNTPVVTAETTGTNQDAGYVNASSAVEGSEITFIVDAFVQALGDNNCGGTGAPIVTFTDDFTTSTGWTYTGGSPSELAVDSISFPDVLRAQCLRSTAQGGAQHIEKSLGATINAGDSQTGDIVWEFDWKHEDGCGGFKGTADFAITGTSAHYGDNLNQAGLVMLWEPAPSFGSGDPQDISAQYNDGITIVTTSKITISSFTTFFPRITKEKTGTLKLEIFTDSGRTIHASGSPVSIDASSVQNKELKFIQFCSTGGGGAGRLLRAEIDDVLLVENAGCPTFNVDALLQTQGTCGFTTFIDNIGGNSASWTEVDSAGEIEIDLASSGVLEWNNLRGGGTTAETFAHRQIPNFADNAGLITLRVKVDKISSNIPSGRFLVIQNNALHPNPSTGSSMQLFLGTGTTNGGMACNIGDGTTSISTSPQIDFVNGLTRYLEGIYDPVAQTLTLNIYTDAGFSIHATGSPVIADASSISMTGLTFTHMITSNVKNSGISRVVTADLDDFTVIAGGCPSFNVDAEVVDRLDADFEVDAFIQASGDDGACPIPETTNFYSTPNSLSLAERQGGGTNRAGEQIIDGTHVGKAIEDVRWFLRRNGTGATGSLFATVRNESDDIIAVSTNSILAQSLPTSGAGVGITFTFPERVILQLGDRILLEFPNCVGCGASSPNVFMFGVAGPPPSGWSRTFFSLFTFGYNKPEDNQDFHQSGDISFGTSSAIPGEQHGCAEVNAVIQASPQDDFEFTVDGIPFVPPAVLFNVDAVLDANNQEIEFFVDSCLRSPFRKDFDLDACIQRQKNDHEFTVDGHVFILPVRNILVDAIVRYAQGSSTLGAIPDLIIRVLRENGVLTGNQIVDEIVIITSNPAEGISFRGKTSRIKNWISRLELDQLIQQDNSDPDWHETNWELGPLGLPLP